MAVRSCAKSSKKRRSIIRHGFARHQQVYRVTTDNPSDGTMAAVCCDGLPKLGDKLQDGSECVEIEADPARDDRSGCKFEVFVTFEKAEVNANGLRITRPNAA